MQFILPRQGHKWQLWLAVFVLAELLSWLAFSFSWINLVVLVVIGLVTGFLVYLRPSFAIYIPLAELFWGSLGHSFEYYFINARLLIFVVVVLVFWFFNILHIKKLKILKDKWLLALYLFLILLFTSGLISGYFNNYAVKDIFMDANAYLYLAYLPIWYQIYQKKYLANIVYILQAAALVVSIKTLLIFNIFVHNYSFLDTTSIYKWIRDSRTGEITPFDNSFVRVFMQSQFYVLAAWFVTFIKYVEGYKNKYSFILLSIFSSALIISLSRSFWLGAFVALLILLVSMFFYQRRLPHWLLYLSIAGSVVCGIIITDVFYNLPNYHNLNIFTQRGVDTSEAAVSSRQALLPVMWEAIKQSPMIGHGFGRQLTYYSDDPRIKTEENPKGEYTTYAFEWGWLDQWLKAGIIFIACLLLWVLLIYIRSWRLINHYPEIAFISIALISSLIFIHIFSPYLNHPLGLGMIMFLTIFVSKYAQQSQSYN